MMHLSDNLLAQILAYQVHNLIINLLIFPCNYAILTNTFHEHDPVQLTPCVVLTTLSWLHLSYTSFPILDLLIPTNFIKLFCRFKEIQSKFSHFINPPTIQGYILSQCIGIVSYLYCTFFHKAIILGMS